MLAAALAASTAWSLQAPVDRRALLRSAATATVLAAPFPAVARIDEIVDRARTGTLSTERVILRALRDEMIEPRDIDDCDVLEKVEKIDLKAADEIVRTNGDLLKLRAATQDTRYEREYLRGVENTYELGRLVEQRIRERAAQINFKYQKECVVDFGDSKNRFREKREDFSKKTSFD